MLEIVDFNGSIKELDVEYPIECLRNKNDTYRVSYLGNSGVAVIIFDNSGNKILGNVFNTHTSKIDFDVLTSLEVIDYGKNDFFQEEMMNTSYDFLKTALGV